MYADGATAKEVEVEVLPKKRSKRRVLESQETIVEPIYTYSSHVGWDGTLLIMCFILASIFPFVAIIRYKYLDRPFVFVLVIFIVIYIFDAFRYILCWKRVAKAVTKEENMELIPDTNHNRRMVRRRTLAEKTVLVIGEKISDMVTMVKRTYFSCQINGNP